VKTTYKIPPDKTLMEDIGATSFTLAEAVVELVANSIDARPLDKAGMPKRKLHVDVTVDSDKVVVVDDANGMTIEVLVNAVRLGAKMDEILGMRKRKGMYGLGLKTAAASIGRYWAVLTRPRDEKDDYFLEFDLQKFKASKTGSIDDWLVEVETRSRNKDSELGDRKSGTAVIIKKLRDKLVQPGAVTQYIGDAYKPHIEAGDVISINGVASEPTGYNFLEDSKQEIDVVISAEHGWRVRGWVALDSKTHNDGEYGFNLYRENQLIETWDKSWFKAHLMTSRIIGEAHIDFMPVNFNKQGFKTQSEQWTLAKEEMEKFLKPVVRASQDANRGRNDTTKLKRAVQGMKRAMSGLTGDDEEGKPEKQGDGQLNESASKSKNNTPPDQVTSKFILIKGHKIVPTCEIIDWGTEVTPWDYTNSDFNDGTEVQTVLNSASRLYQKATDQSILGILAVADCVTRFLVEHRDISPSEARELRDRWILEALNDSKIGYKAKEKAKLK
jgi:hypothetical protein